MQYCAILRRTLISRKFKYDAKCRVFGLIYALEIDLTGISIIIEDNLSDSALPVLIYYPYFKNINSLFSALRPSLIIPVRVKRLKYLNKGKIYIQF